MTVRRVYAGSVSAEVEHEADQRCLRELGSDRRILPEELSPALDALVMASGFVPPDTNPTDAALAVLHSALSDGAPSSLQPVPSVLRTLPFDSERKMATQVIALPGGVAGIAHGAAERVLGQALRVLDDEGRQQPLDEATRGRLSSLIDAWAAEGLRVLGVARSETVPLEPAAVQALARNELIERFERELVLLGFVGMADPPRSGVDQAILRARAAGVSTIMVTGDHPLTARSIAREVGLLDQDGEIVQGQELDKLGQTELGTRSEQIRVVARATPESKLRLVEALRARGHVVAMTGDGVNDAPAIKAASIGIAMGRSGTDVAREAADMVLFDDNYATIVAAIEEGRVIYGNIKRFILFLFSVNAGLVASVFVAAVLGWPPILTPTQILWINLITNGLPALALGMEPVHVDPMREKPRNPKAPLLDRTELVWLCIYGALMAALGLTTFASYQARVGGVLEGELLERARTATFTVLAIGPLFHALNCRSRDESLFSLGIWSNWRLLGAFAAALVLQAIAVYVPPVERVFGTSPLPLREVVMALAVSASVWIVGEGEKLARRSLRIQPARR
jgi:Ca2+-transporting ATPase